MSARPEAVANQIADALVKKLSRISREKQPSEWLTSPHVDRGLFLGDMSAPRPALYVSVQRWDHTPGASMGVSGVHESILTLAVACVSESALNTRGAEIELNNLAADVVRAVSLKDEPVEFNIDQAVVYFNPVFYEPQVDLMERVGLGVTAVIVETRFRWSTQAP